MIYAVLGVPILKSPINCYISDQTDQKPIIYPVFGVFIKIVGIAHHTVCNRLHLSYIIDYIIIIYISDQSDRKPIIYPVFPTYMYMYRL